jgi:hypothetical protein
MSRDRRPRQKRPGSPRLGTLVALPAVLALAACQSTPGPAPQAAAWPASFSLTPGTQQGEVTVREGADTEVHYPKAYQAPPRVVLVELRGANAKETLYSKDDFQIVRQEATYFRVRNNHTEHGESWATIKWRAEGTLAPAGDKPAAANGDSALPESLVERIKSAGGKVTLDGNLPQADAVKTASAPAAGKNVAGILTSNVEAKPLKDTVVAVDLHRTRTGDGDLAQLEGLTHVQTLNLYGTKVTDAGLQSLSGLTSLQTLYLNNTEVTDAGLQHLQGLKKLYELGLNKTRVTDAGLSYLRGLSGLHSLSLSGTKVTDRGLEVLKSLRSLKRLTLSGTGVTAAGIKDLQKVLPSLRVIK